MGHNPHLSDSFTLSYFCKHPKRLFFFAYQEKNTADFFCKFRPVEREVTVYNPDDGQMVRPVSEVQHSDSLQLTDMKMMDLFVLKGFAFKLFLTATFYEKKSLDK